MNYKDSIIYELDTMRKADIARKEPFAARAYAKVITELKAMDTPIRSYDDVKSIPGAGAKIKEKMKEIIETGTLKSAERARELIPIALMESLQAVHGIGPVKAKELIEKDGIKSIDELREAVKKNPDLLNDVQKLGLKHYNDAILRIPRKEMEEHEKFILKALDPVFKAAVVGSYRRGAADSGDIDVLLTLPNDMKTKEKGEKFLELVKILKDKGYIVDTLAQGPKKFLGYVMLDDTHHVRRLDLLMTPEDEFAYAILYFTGSQGFNVAFRKYVLAKGYTINEHTMKPMREGLPEVPPMKTEEDIFKFLGLDYVIPTERRGEKDIKPIPGTEPKPEVKPKAEAKPKTESKTKAKRARSKTRKPKQD